MGALIINEAALANATEESKNIFNCVLKLSNWVELTQVFIVFVIVHFLFYFKEKDVCGFGLAVGRPEWVVDDPSQIRVFSTS